VRRLVAFLLAQALIVSTSVASSLHVHEYVGHDHPDHLSFAKIVMVVREVAGDPRANVASRIAGIDERSTALAPLPVRPTRTPQRVRSTAHVRLRVIRSDGVVRRLPERRPLGLR
jgi:hypothetical protein